MDQEIISRLKQKLDEHDLDAIVAISPENVTYVSGLVVPSQSLMRWRHAICVLTADGRACMIAIDMEATTVKAHAGIEDLRVYREFTDDPMDHLAQALRDLHLERAHVAIEMEYLPAKDFAALRQLAPDVRWAAAEPIFNKARQIKSTGELELLRELSRLTDRAIGDTLREARVGQSELDLAGMLLSKLFAAGAENFKLMIIASGERSQFPNVGPTSRRLRPGDLIRMEIFGQKGGYLAGICRTAVVGEPDREQETIWSNLIECKKLVMEAIRPGAPCKEIYATFLHKFTELGLEPISFVGHGIGLFLHEEPYMGRYGGETLAEGMVVAIEPLVYIPGRMGLQNKDMLAVTATGCELLSNYTPTDNLLRVG